MPATLNETQQHQAGNEHIVATKAHVTDMMIRKLIAAGLPEGTLKGSPTFMQAIVRYSDALVTGVLWPSTIPDNLDNAREAVHAALKNEHLAVSGTYLAEMEQHNGDVRRRINEGIQRAQGNEQVASR